MAGIVCPEKKGRKIKHIQTKNPVVLGDKEVFCRTGNIWTNCLVPLILYDRSCFFYAIKNFRIDFL